MTKTGKIPPALLQLIFEQAVREYPHECCGMILGPKSEEGVLTRVRTCRNVQDDYHSRDPENFPRTSATAYFIDPRELLEIQKEVRRQSEAIRILYHSHVNAGAYFSDEDKRIALVEGEPAYPGVAYLVVSVREGRVNDWCLYHWDAEKKEFLP